MVIDGDSQNTRTVFHRYSVNVSGGKMNGAAWLALIYSVGSLVTCQIKYNDYY